MNEVKSHYTNHLGKFYSWMAGDFDTKSEEQKSFFNRNNIKPIQNGVAVDLGCGHGLQSIPLADLRYKVIAIDFNEDLLHELKTRTINSIEIIEDDLLHFDKHLSQPAELIVCMGDTLTHLASKNEVETLIKKACDNLIEGGKLILSFRDLTSPLNGSNRFLPVRSDDTKIHTCFLEYFDEHVQVYDLLHVKENQQWIQKISSYPKLILPIPLIKSFMNKAGFSVTCEEEINRMRYLIAEKNSSAS